MKTSSLVLLMATLACSAMAKDPPCTHETAGQQSLDGKRICSYDVGDGQPSNRPHWVTLPVCDKKHENDTSHELTCTAVEDRYEWLKVADSWKESSRPPVNSVVPIACGDNSATIVTINRDGDQTVHCMPLKDSSGNLSDDEKTAFWCGVKAVIGIVDEDAEDDGSQVDCAKFASRMSMLKALAERAQQNER
jgi:hypothetical protein